MRIKYSGKNISIKLQQLKKLKNARVKVGFPKGFNAYPDGTPVALVASVQEFGSPSRNIPSRPFFRSTLFINKNYKDLRFKTFSQIARGKITPSVGLGRLGDVVKNDIVESIVAIQAPTLKAETIKKKKSSNPLVDTGHLKQSVTYKVEL